MLFRFIGEITLTFVVREEKEKEEKNKWNKNSYRVEIRLKHLHVSWHVLNVEKFMGNLVVAGNMEFKFERKGLEG